MIATISDGSLGWANYVTNGTKSKPRNKNKIEIIKDIVFIDIDGVKRKMRFNDPFKTEDISKAVSSQDKYFKYVFSVKGKPDPKKLKEAYAEWLSLIMYGYQESEYMLSAVAHFDSENDHIHGLIPKIHLTSGNKLKFYYDKTDRKRKELIDQYIDLKYGFESPDNNKELVKESQNEQIDEWKKQNKQETIENKYKTIIEKINNNEILSSKENDFFTKTKTKKDRQKFIQNMKEIVIQKHEFQKINSYEDLVDLLNNTIENMSVVNTGFDNKKNQNYITLEYKNKKIRLMGAIYGKHFWGNQRENRSEEIKSDRSRKGSPGRNIKDITELKIKINRENEKRKQFIDKTYRYARKKFTESVENNKKIYTDSNLSIVNYNSWNINSYGNLRKQSEQRDIGIKTNKSGIGTVQGMVRGSNKLKQMINTLKDKKNIFQNGISLSLSTHVSQNYKEHTFDNISDFWQSVLHNNYSAASYLNEHRTGENVTKINNIAIFDIDNDKSGQFPITIEKMQKKIEDLHLAAIIIPSKSHRIVSKKNPKGHDRFRIILPAQNSIVATKKDIFVYREYMYEIAEKIGVETYIDTRASNDIVRLYNSVKLKNPNPNPTYTIINGDILNNLQIWKQAQKVVEITEKNKEEIARLKAIAKLEKVNKKIITGYDPGLFSNVFSKESTVNNTAADNTERIKPSKNQQLNINSNIKSGEYYKFIDFQELINIPIYDALRQLTIGKKLVIDILDNSEFDIYRTSNGHFTRVENSNLLYDLKSQETFNVYTLIKHFKNTNDLRDVASYLDPLGYVLDKINYDLIKKKFDKAMETAINDRTFISKMKEITGVRNVKVLAKGDIQFLDFTFNTLTDCSIDRREMLKKFKENKASGGGTSTVQKSAEEKIENFEIDMNELEGKNADMPMPN